MCVPCTNESQSGLLGTKEMLKQMVEKVHSANLERSTSLWGALKKTKQKQQRKKPEEKYV